MLALPLRRRLALAALSAFAFIAIESITATVPDHVGTAAQDSPTPHAARVCDTDTDTAAPARRPG